MYHPRSWFRKSCDILDLNRTVQHQTYDASFNLDKDKNNKSICDRIARMAGQTYSFKEIMKNFDNERDLTVNVLQFTNEKEGFRNSITIGTNIYFI